VAVTVAGTTTCLMPQEPAGTACPAAASGGDPLVDLLTSGVDTAVTAAAGSASTVTLSLADAGPAAISGSDVVANVTVTGAAGTWSVSATAVDTGQL
jgi:hypothetical protein